MHLSHSMILPVGFALATFVSTMVGGLFALKFKNYLHRILGFTAGVLLGVVAFDIFPEIIQRIQSGLSVTNAMIALVLGFLVFHILEKTIVIHHGQEDSYADHHHPDVGVLSALALVGHSLMDGLGIGLGFHVNPALGTAVAIAVISHDFTDGMNTVTLLLTNNNSTMRSRIFLFFDAFAPVVGVILAYAFAAPHNNFVGLYLGFFAGFLLYIGASDILPEAHSKKSSFATIGLTLVGVILVFIITRFV